MELLGNKFIEFELLSIPKYIAAAAGKEFKHEYQQPHEGPSSVFSYLCSPLQGVGNSLVFVSVHKSDTERFRGLGIKSCCAKQMLPLNVAQGQQQQESPSGCHFDVSGAECDLSPDPSDECFSLGIVGWSF